MSQMPPMASAPPIPRITPPLISWLALGVLLACVLGLAQMAHEPFPYWSLDPLLVPTEATWLGPTGQIVLACVAITAAIIASATFPGRFSRGEAAAWILLLIATGVVWWHGRGGRGSLDDWRIGLCWLSAWAGALCVRRLVRAEAMRRVIAASLLGFVAIVCLVGVVQVFIDHPRTVANYAQNREAFLAAQGWSEGSSMARAFERRLRQGEATGWFGLANPLATFAAGWCVVFLGLSIVAWKKRAGVLVRFGIIAGAALSVLLLILCGSKGGYAAAGLGIILALIGFMSRRRNLARPVLGRALGLGVLALVLGAIAARGLVAERAGELSLYFRWLYWKAASRIMLEYPLLGTGPAGFRDAFLLAKDPTCPEDVTSPHNLLVDLAGTLGLAGLGLAVLWLGWAAGLGRMLTTPPRREAKREDSSSPNLEIRLALFPFVLSAMLAWWMESAQTTPPMAAAKLIGLFATGGIALAILGLLRSGTTALLVLLPAAALGMAAHALIDVSATLTGSCGLFMLLLAAGAPGDSSSASGPARSPRWLLVALLLPITLALQSRSVAAWETRLSRANDHVLPVARLHARVNALAAGDPEEKPDALARDLGLPARPSLSLQDLQTAWRAGSIPAMHAALDLLESAARAEPTHAPTLQAASRLALQLADAHRASGAVHEAARADELAVSYAEQATRCPRGQASSFAWLGTVLIAQSRHAPNPAVPLNKAVGALERAHALAPFTLLFPTQLADVHQQLGDLPGAKSWALRALELDAALRLDPLVGLEASQREHLRALAATP